MFGMAPIMITEPSYSSVTGTGFDGKPLPAGNVSSVYGSASDFSAAWKKVDRGELSGGQSNADIAYEDFLRDLESSRIADERAMSYNTMMSNTQYQRAVEDLKKAGLNPILAYQNPATSPTISGHAFSSSSNYSDDSGRSSANLRNQIIGGLTLALISLLLRA